jgi:O-antigen/teichoic acid export membrane protein
MSGWRIARNVVARLAAKAVVYPLGFVASVVLIRYLGVEGLGQYNYFSTFASLFGLVAGLGLPILLTREAARDRPGAARHLGDALVLQAGLSGLAVVVVATAGLALNPVTFAVPIALFGVSVALTALGAPYLAMLNAFEHMHLGAGIEVACTLLRVLAILAAIRLGLDVTGLVALLLVVPVSYLLLAKLASDRRCAPAAFAPAPARLRALLRATTPFALLTLFGTAYFRLDILMLEKMQDVAAVGIYSAAYKLVDVLLVVGVNTAGVVYPVMATQAGHAPAALHQTIESTYRYMAAAGFPLGVAVTFLAAPIVTGLFGDAFAPSVVPLRILIWAVVLMFVSAPLTHALNATRHEWVLIAILGANTAINVLANLVLIPAYGVVGAAASTVACEVVNLALVIRFVRRRIAPLAWIGSLAPVVGAAAVTAGPLWYLGEQHPIAAAVAAAGLYAAALLGLGFLRPSERFALLRLLAPGSAR